MKHAVEARSLTKKFGERVAVNRAQFAVNKGEFFGIIGPNGAGKTTTLSMIYGLTKVTSGELYVLGLDAKKNTQRIKKLVGVVPQDNGLDTDFTVIDNLTLFASYFGISRKESLPKARELLRTMNLEDYEDSPIEALSGGMKRRLAIARALMNSPELLVLDEPTTGLDPKARLWIWESLATLKKRGTTLVMTTHYMEEAERLCDRIAIMDQGRVLGSGSPCDLISGEIGDEVVEFDVEPKEVDYYVNRIKTDFEYQLFNNRLRLFLKPGQESKSALKLVTSNNITIRKPSLDDVFLKVAGHEIVGDLV